MLCHKNTPIDQILSMGEIIDPIEDTLKEIAAGRGYESPCPGHSLSEPTDVRNSARFGTR